MITETKIILNKDEAEHELARHFANERGIPQDGRLIISIEEDGKPRYWNKIRAILSLAKALDSSAPEYRDLKWRKETVEKIIAASGLL